MQLGNADVIATSNVVAMCGGAVLAGAYARYLVIGVARNDAWIWSKGAKLYLSTNGTSGNTLTQTAPSGVDDVIQIIGFALDTSIAFINPSLVQTEHI